MRIFLLLLFIFFLTLGVHAQQHKQADTTVNHHVPIIKIDKAELLNNIDVIANTQAGLNNNFTDGSYSNSRFAVNQFRLEIKGNVFENKVFFRFRDRYTRDPEVQSVDNISRSTDIAFIGYNISDKTSIAIGKMTANWGGFEFDMNPIDIYQYNDIVDNADNFLTGVQFNWKISSEHTLSAQVLNSRTKTFEELYKNVPDLREAKFPAAYVGTWNGSFLEGKFQTIWSFSIFQEASKQGSPVNMYYTALGNQFRSKKWLLQYDFKWSSEDLDRSGMVSAFVPDHILPHAAQHVSYLEHWLRIVYSVNEQWKISTIGMVNTASWKDVPEEMSTSNKLRTSWGLIPSVEFYPIKNYNLKFFASYVGRFYRYNDYAKQNFEASNASTGRIMIGIASPLLIL
ncbi:porin [Olivibacter domesticus]|uniref:porin n=1 Tax=Olivibacter domesticus TaxID=407022 RepID=UPI0036231B50